MQNTTGRQTALLQAAAKVAHDVIAILDPDELLIKTVDTICEAFGFYYAGVFILDESRNWALLRAGYGQAGRSMTAQGHQLRVGGQSMIGTAIAERRALIALDVGEAPVHFDNPHLPLTRSEMALPMMLGDQVIGALTVQSTEESAFTLDDITALQTMADQLAVALHNAHLHQQNQNLLVAAERRARLLEAAAEVGHGVTSILDLDELLSKTVDIICDAYGFYFACIYLIDSVGEWLELSAAYGEAGQKMIASGYHLSVDGQSINGAVVTQGKARIAQDVELDPVHFKNPYLPETRAEMALPLWVAGKIIGTLGVQSTEPGAFQDQDITSLQAMADQLAIAINNARLLQALEEAHAELVRSKTFEALATSTIEAIHWIGNKALPISTSIERVRDDLDLVSADAEIVDSMREDLGMIETNAQLIVSVREHLIGPAREQKPQPVMVDDILSDTLVAFELAKGLVSLDIASNMPLALADSSQLSRAIGYVLQNALEAVQDVAQPHIKISVSPTQDQRFVLIRVTDNGPGILEADMDKIWAAFYTTKQGDHAGLGLSAALRIFHQLSGQVAARQAPGGGAQIDLYVPVASATASDASFPENKVILLIDDLDPWSRFAERTLAAAGNTVIVASSSGADLEGYDLILVDNVLVGQSAPKLLRSFRGMGIAGKTIVVASHLQVEGTMALMNLGIADVVAKPYTEAALAELVSQV